MEVTICIPARLKSVRFPGKVLANLAGKSVLQHVFDRVASLPNVGDVVVLCDSKVVRVAAENFGARVIDTAEACSSGTERIVSALDRISGDFIINVQGDEVFFDATVIRKMVAKCGGSDAHIFTPIYKFDSMEDALDPSRVKVVLGHDGRALYFSRSVIPFVRDEKNVDKWLQHTDLYGHVGIYGFRRTVLENYHNLAPGKLESVEKLEQLRFLESGYAIDTVRASQPSFGIDTPADLAKANTLIANQLHNFNA
ncbi:MAG: 3-deoxy-manno-octulosonate cytidylyltransferase [Puniceicoccales bacterium]|jgi:3-deoxy-manno-octulosonate cytidylyltransferase (CMP-KDO synthetase)|nr:3-deoxy-manno-octulosonate cytidylyltransferase [Puniceicoccales bacterium]